jgi:hypothetical protein
MQRPEAGAITTTYVGVGDNISITPRPHLNAAMTASPTTRNHLRNLNSRNLNSVVPAADVVIIEATHRLYSNQYQYSSLPS